MNNKAFTLVEILIATFIMSLVLTFAYPPLISMITASKVESFSNEAHLDKITGTELIRMDFEHANFGIGVNEANLPISWDSANDVFQLNTTLNNTNQSTIGWALYDCSSGGNLRKNGGNLIKDRRQDDTNTCLTLLDSNRNYLGVFSTSDTCPGNDVYTAFPLGVTAVNPCKSQHYSSIRYSLSGIPNYLPECAQGTQNLLRSVDGSSGVPILNCIADINFTFDLDTDTNGTIDSFSATAPPTTNAQDVLEQVKNINMFILLQAGKKDDTLNSNENITIDANLSKAGITAPEKYRWKVVRVSGKPMSW